jgi:hypothetical protein
MAEPSTSRIAPQRESYGLPLVAVRDGRVRRVYRIADVVPESPRHHERQGVEHARDCGGSGGQKTVFRDMARPARTAPSFRFNAVPEGGGQIAYLEIALSRRSRVAFYGA